MGVATAGRVLCQKGVRPLLPRYIILQPRAIIFDSPASAWVGPAPSVQPSWPYPPETPFLHTFSHVRVPGSSSVHRWCQGVTMGAVPRCTQGAIPGCHIWPYMDPVFSRSGQKRPETRGVPPGGPQKRVQEWVPESVPESVPGTVPHSQKRCHTAGNSGKMAGNSGKIPEKL